MKQPSVLCDFTGRSVWQELFFNDGLSVPYVPNDDYLHICYSRFHVIPWEDIMPHVLTLNQLTLLCRAAGEHMDVTSALSEAAKCGNLLFCQWLIYTFWNNAIRRSIKHAFKCAAEEGHIVVCQWLAAPWIVADSALRLAAERGHLKVCQWLLQSFKCSEIQNAFIAAVYGGHLSLCEWIYQQKRGYISVADALPLAARKNRLPICKWILDHSNPSREKICIAFGFAAERNRMHVCEWLTERCGLTTIDARYDDNYALMWAAANGHLSMCQWLTQRFGLTREDVSVYAHYALQLAMIDGFEDVCQWIVDFFGVPFQEVEHLYEYANHSMEGFQWFTRQFGDDLRVEQLTKMALSCDNGSEDDLNIYRHLVVHIPHRHVHCFGLQLAAHCGDVSFCQWLTDRFGLTAEDARAAYVGTKIVRDNLNYDAKNYALRRATSYGHVSMCQWLVDRFGLTAEDARTNDNEAFRNAAENGHLQMCQWLTERFQLTTDDLRITTDFKCTSSFNPEIVRSAALVNAYRKGRYSVCQWMIVHFGLTCQDAENCLRFTTRRGTIALNRLLDALWGGSYCVSSQLQHVVSGAAQHPCCGAHPNC